ncbi:hypothetical protein FDG96_gp77 [Bacillus phage Mgbh1]|uniref:Nucleotide modification associated domain-containing protein n=1 Tax=Bacillus phage Mgbh1 TaxID=1796993 RepID=A0A142F1S9_9CAUD|nr:hypothetical protein FDG96_gp77 [Bacillus phage Mgbh1]AMQ66736.1 hypothetical protein [Bacillus phage Mgbh1]
MAKYVRVVKASEPCHWYANRIGEVFEFVDACVDLTGGYYECKDGYRIRCKDAEKVTVHEHEGELYTEVDREAEVGDTVLVTRLHDKEMYEVYEVMRRHTDTVTISNVHKQTIMYIRRGCWRGHDQYRVLEPLVVSVPSEAPKSTDDIVANLTRRTYEAEERIEALETGQRVLHKMIDGDKLAVNAVTPHNKKLTITSGTLSTSLKIKRPTTDLIAEVADDVRDLLIRKNGDYGDSFSKQYAEYGLMSSLIRMDDKIQRLKTLESGHEAQVDESIDDTLRDLAGYAVLTLVARKEQKMDEN